MEIKVKRSRDDEKPLIFDVNLGNNTPEAVALFNIEGSPYGDVVHELFLVGALQQFRAFVLGCIENKITGAALNSKVAAWRPEVKHRGKPPLEKALKAAKSLSAEEREALIRSLQAV